MPKEQQNTTNCCLYFPGHNVHWIQAKLALQALAQARPVLVTCKDGQVLVTENQTTTAYRNHHPELIAAALKRTTGPCLLMEYGALGIPLGKTLATFYLAPVDGPWKPCWGERVLDVEHAEVLPNGRVYMKLRDL